MWQRDNELVIGGITGWFTARLSTNVCLLARMQRTLCIVSVDIEHQTEKCTRSLLGKGVWDLAKGVIEGQLLQLPCFHGNENWIRISN